MKKISLAALASLALLASTAASAGEYEYDGYRHHGGGHGGHNNNASFYIGVGPHGHVSYGVQVGAPRVYVRPQHHWRPVHQPRYNHHRPHRMHQRVVHRSHGYCDLHRGWHR